MIVMPHEIATVLGHRLPFTFCSVSSARSDEQYFFGEVWHSICVHKEQRKVLKKLCYRTFANVSLFVLQALQKTEGVCRIPHL